jgi:hypothetical protein
LCPIRKLEIILWRRPRKSCIKFDQVSTMELEPKVKLVKLLTLQFWEVINH